LTSGFDRVAAAEDIIKRYGKNDAGFEGAVEKAKGILNTRDKWQAQSQKWEKEEQGFREKNNKVSSFSRSDIPDIDSKDLSSKDNEVRNKLVQKVKQEFVKAGFREAYSDHANRWESRTGENYLEMQARLHVNWLLGDDSIKDIKENEKWNVYHEQQLADKLNSSLKNYRSSIKSVIEKNKKAKQNEETKENPILEVDPNSSSSSYTKGSSTKTSVPKTKPQGAKKICASGN